MIHSLAEASLQRWILFTYDIWCQYSIKFKTRVAQWFPAMADIIDLVRGAIPKMHIHNHIELCQLIWNLNWLIYSAFTAGEMIETGWVEHNLTAGSTKEQNDGNRHDSVDDTSGNHNWNKLVGLGMPISPLYGFISSSVCSGCVATAVPSMPSGASQTIHQFRGLEREASGRADRKVGKYADDAQRVPG